MLSYSSTIGGFEEAILEKRFFFILKLSAYCVCKWVAKLIFKQNKAKIVVEKLWLGHVVLQQKYVWSDDSLRSFSKLIFFMVCMKI